MRAKKSLGQNFLTSKAIAVAIVKAAEITASDTILEVGPGKGILTIELLKRARRVIAVEKDDDLITHLKERLSDEIASGKLKLIHGDILTFNPQSEILQNGKYKIVANIPYNITGLFLKKMLAQEQQPSSMTLLVQKEVAERIARDKKESILSISVKVYGVPKYVQKVKAIYFKPRPKVDSAIFKIENISKKFFNGIEEEQFFEIVKRGFAHKRKLLIKNLKNTVTEDKLPKNFEGCGIKPNARAENLELSEWKCLCKNLP